MIFDKFKGIQKEREIKEREKGNLELLLDFCDNILQKYTNNFPEIPSDISELYDHIYEDFKKSKLFLDEEHLKNFLYAKSNQGYAEDKSQCLGLLSGCLLQFLTKKNRAKRKRTRFYIDGKGSRFDYLFYFTKQIDEVIVDSFAGDHICSHVGRGAGCWEENPIGIETIMILNCKGNYLADTICFMGHIKSVLVANSQGDNILYDVGRNDGGHVESVFVVNCAGKNLADRAGEMGGRVESLFAVNNKGEEAINYAGDIDGRVGTILVANHQGDYVAAYANHVDSIIVVNNQGNYSVHNAGCKRACVGTILLAYNQDHSTASAAGTKGNVDKLIHYGLTGKSIAENSNIKEIITGESALEEYTKMSRAYELDKLIGLADSMKDGKDLVEKAFKMKKHWCKK